MLEERRPLQNQDQPEPFNNMPTMVNYIVDVGLRYLKSKLYLL